MSVVSRNDVERFPLTDDYSNPPKSTRSQHCQAPDWQHALFTTRSWYVYQETDAHTHILYWSNKHSVCNQPLSGFSRLSCLYSAIAFIFNTDLFCISSSGSTGVFCEFRSNDRRMLDFLRTLGLLHLLTVEGLQPGLVIMGTKLWIMSCALQIFKMWFKPTQSFYC